MIFEPRNRKLSVKMLDLKETKSSEDLEIFQKSSLLEIEKKTNLTVCVVDSISPDVTTEVATGDWIVVQKNMIESWSFQGQEFHYVLENYIEGILYHDSVEVE